MTASLFSTFSLLLASLFLPQLVVPKSPDSKITIKRTSGDSFTAVVTLYLKGARQRVEYTYQRTVGGRTIKNDFVEIRQCDERQRIILKPSAKTYIQAPIGDWAERSKRAKLIPQNEVSPEVNVTIDSVDTGERRRYGSYVARHVKTTTRVEPSPGAATLARTEEVDGWYIDLPGLGCEENPNRGAFVGCYFQAADAPLRRDRMQIKRLGTAAHGFPVAEKTIKAEGGEPAVGEVTLIELSEDALDPSLFTLPSGYSPALETAGGGHDMTKPDTLSNRVQQYWAVAQRWFR